MKLIREEIRDVEVLTEEHNGKKNTYLEGIFMQSVPNKNGRIYPMETLVNEVNRYIKEKVSTKRSYGELGHPKGPSINLDRISHIVESLKPEGKNIIGRAKLTETPMGNIAKGIIESGGQLGMSSRGLGSLKKLDDGLLEVQEDFKLITAADIVADPSAPDAFVNGIMENVEWVFKNGEWIAEAAEPIQKQLKKMSRRQIEESKMRVFEHFLNKISKTK